MAVGVIVDVSVAGAKPAQAGFDGRVVLIGKEPSPKDARHELSQGHLVGDKTLADMLVHPAEFHAEHDIEVRTARSPRGRSTSTRVGQDPLMVGNQATLTPRGGRKFHGDSSPTAALFATGCAASGFMIGLAPTFTRIPWASLGRAEPAHQASVGEQALLDNAPVAR